MPGYRTSSKSDRGRNSDKIVWISFVLSVIVRDLAYFKVSGSCYTDDYLHECFKVCLAIATHFKVCLACVVLRCAWHVTRGDLLHGRASI